MSDDGATLHSAGSFVVRREYRHRAIWHQGEDASQGVGELDMCQRIAKALLKHAKSLDWGKPVEGQHIFTLPEADKLFVGVLFDQGMDTAWAWDAADWIVESVESFGDEESGFWDYIANLEQERLKGFMEYGWGGYALHRYTNKMPRYLQDCARFMIDIYGGDPRGIWNMEWRTTCIQSKKSFREISGNRSEFVAYGCAHFGA